MRSVHLASFGESSQYAIYAPTSRAGAPLIVEFVPEAVTDHDVARLATSCAITVALGHRRVLAYGSLQRRTHR